MIQWLKIKKAYINGLWKAYNTAETFSITKEKKQVYVMLAANYGNLGDIAITFAQEKFICETLGAEYEVIMVPHDKTYSYFRHMKKHMNEDSIITLIGGGNSGTLYEFIEQPRRFILKFFRNYRIISFPQSVFYDGSRKMSAYKSEFVRLCKRCKRLTLIAREDKSYYTYNDLVGDIAEVLMAPDIVFSLDMKGEQCDRQGICFIFRQDKEKGITEQIQKTIEEKCRKMFDDISYNDTCEVQIEDNGYREFMSYINLLGQKALIVTDRLHGMIFAHITNTPCIVLDNNNHKIESSFRCWLEGQSLISIIYDESELEVAIEKVLKGHRREDLNSSLRAIRLLLEERRNG